ncbi:MAG: magnesium transporter [Acidimicrobiaceae bacterium]|nr:magnesium transporter [Acidimicrobiaceae bacterium]MDE0606757.1 magnesium transporter [Acidimicrobiaceae bacterium]
MKRRFVRAARRWRAVISRDGRAYRDSFVALVLSAITSLVAGVTLATTTGTLEELPGLLLLVPAALAVKGNVFGALGSRLGTSIHAGTFRLSPRLDSAVGQNIAAAMLLSLAISVLIAVLAKGVAIVFAVSPTMSLADFVVVSTLGGLLASVFMLAITLLLANGSGRFGWDLDNVVSPLVTAASDLMSLPALILAAQLAGLEVFTPVTAALLAAVSVGGVVWALITDHRLLGAIVRESIPVLALAGLLDLIAGITIEKRLDDLLEYPVLLVLLPGFLGTAGGLGGVLSSRLSTKVHLGLLHPGPVPRGSAGADIAMIFGLSIPVFAITGLVAELGGALTSQASPGLPDVVAVALAGGLLATICVVVVAYYTTIIAVRFGLDPDTHGIPMVTSSLDFVGAFTLILAIVAVGVA